MITNSDGERESFVLKNEKEKKLKTNSFLFKILDLSFRIHMLSRSAQLNIIFLVVSNWR